MKNIFRQSNLWAFQSIQLLRGNIRFSLFLGMLYLFLYIILPSLPKLGFLMPLVVLVWPIVITIYVSFFKSLDSNKAFKFSEALKMPNESLKGLLALGVLCLFYTLLISFVLSDDLKSLVLLSKEAGEIEGLAESISHIFIKLAILSLPLYAVTWFSPLLVRYNNFNLLKAVKSSFAGILAYIIPISITWLILLGGFLSLTFIIIFVFSLINASTIPFLSFLLVMIILIIMTAYISVLFAFQYVTYRDIFKDLKTK